jgi:hypothetical protein
MTQIEIPDDVRDALLKILYHTLLKIRAAQNTELTYLLSDHAHNIPSLISSYTPGTFRYYWEIERAEFIRAMDRLGQPFDSFQTHWAILERHHENLETAS